ncbi:SAM-dependent chlorinase/fluorinase [Phormidium sp. CLA17]|uniref:SAM hydrolase/SAM-dependent halogenase family protein n=1 Tax=Leptolyngbya sp. Cla-17 TaxID=2803751 RepID=UPI0014922AE6|nr:SAM-dependent chlorinase/fluorinase [Leptolyngbya sp. Cla-17]MBM0743342.1 SAM-dependent chlorinase/fluorinase [Leptolyngbya sp. Cla-17]
MGQIITLLSDFGLSDSYVSVMKAVIAQINPAVVVIDITHQVPPQNIGSGRFSLMTAVPYFPPKTVHVAVVDPGVGGKRRAVGIGIGTPFGEPVGFLVGPDNGIFSGVLDQFPAYAVVELTNAQFWRTDEPSGTFHGRDIFAPVGAHLASGVPLAELGAAITPDSLVQFSLPPYFQTENTIHGCIQAIDHFGNLITNIPAIVLSHPWSVTIGITSILSALTYSDRRVGEFISFIGSHGWLEIAVNNGSAQTRLNSKIGDPVEVKLDRIGMS